MSDLSDVETALVEIAAAAVYPLGTSQPSVAGIPIRIRRGWPQPAALDDDLKAGSARVSVYSQPGHTRNVTRYPQDWRTTSLSAPTLTAVITADGLTITFGGTGGAGQNVGVLCRGTGYILAVQSTDTPTDVATGLAAQIDGAASSGLVLTLPTPGVVTVAALSGSSQELRRQEQGFMVTAWCPTPGARDAIIAAVDAAFATISFIALPDQQARIKYTDTRVIDASENADMYRRDLFYTVEYSTDATQQSAPMIFPIGAIEGPGGAIASF